MEKCFLSRFLNIAFGQAWWCVSILLTLGRLRQESYQYETSLGYLDLPLKTNKTSKYSLPLNMLKHKLVC